MKLLCKLSWCMTLVKSSKIRGKQYMEASKWWDQKINENSWWIGWIEKNKWQLTDENKNMGSTFWSIHTSD